MRERYILRKFVPDVCLNYHSIPHLLQDVKHDLKKQLGVPDSMITIEVAQDVMRQGLHVVAWRYVLTVDELREVLWHEDRSTYWPIHVLSNDQPPTRDSDYLSSYLEVGKGYLHRFYPIEYERLIPHLVFTKLTTGIAQFPERKTFLSGPDPECPLHGRIA